MGYKPLNRPNNFMLGSKPWFPAVYDENITPLEQMNKLAEKLNEIIGDDTNVKNDVEKLLGVWKDVFMAKAGYIAPIETIYSENPLDFALTGWVNTDEPYELIEGKYVDIDDRYKSIELQCGWSEGKEPKDDSKFVNMVWEYWDGNNYVPYQMDTSVSFAASTVYLPTKGDEFQYRVKCQSKKHTSYQYINIVIADLSIENVSLTNSLYNINDNNFPLSIFYLSTYNVLYDCNIDCNVKAYFYEYRKRNRIDSPITDIELKKETILNTKKITPFLNDQSEINIFDYVENRDYFINSNFTVVFSVTVSNKANKSVTVNYEYDLIVPNFISSINYNSVTLKNATMYSNKLVGNQMQYAVDTNIKLENYITLNYVAFDSVDATNFGVFTLLEGEKSGLLDYSMLFMLKRNWNYNNTGYGYIYKQVIEFLGALSFKIGIINGGLYEKPDELQ